MNSRHLGGWRVPPRDPPDSTVRVRPMTSDERQRYGLDDPEEVPGMAHSLPPATIAIIRTRLAQGETQYAIAKALHVSRSLVQRIAHADPSWPSPSLESKEDPMPKLTEDQKASIRARLAAGESSQAIGASMDVSPFIIQRYAPKRDPAPERPPTAPMASPSAATLEALAAQVETQGQEALQAVLAAQSALEAAQDTLRRIETQAAAIQVVRELLGVPSRASAEKTDANTEVKEGV